MDVVAGHDGMIGAAVEEQAGVYAMANVVIYHPDVVAPLGCNDAVVAFTSKEMVAPHETKEDGMGWCQVAAPCTHVSWTNLPRRLLQVRKKD